MERLESKKQPKGLSAKAVRNINQAISSGLRRGELLGLKWEDIDLENGIIHVRRQVARIEGEIVEAPLKTKNSHRTLSIGADAVEILKERRKKTSGEYVFPFPTSGPM